MNGTNDKCPAPESGQGQGGLYIIAPVSRSSRERPESVRIILSQEDSDTLATAGECFRIIGKGSYPDAVGRLVLHCVPVERSQADAACRVAVGTHRAVRIG
jgi:hypothetical protein